MSTAEQQRRYRAAKAEREGRPVGQPGRRPVQPCGTPAAYRRHRRNHEDPCEPCRLAMKAWNAEQYRRRTST